MLNALVRMMLSLTTVLCFSGALRAEPKVCTELASGHKAVAQQVLRSQHPHDCCDKTIAECLKEKTVCPLVTRLAEDVCRRVAAGKSREDIERHLVQRAASASGRKVVIKSKSLLPVAGEVSAQVEIVAFACARCPYCAALLPLLHQSVTNGRLKGKAKLILVPFPIASHEHSTIANKAWLAAHKQSKFWPMVLGMYAHFKTVTPETLPECAKRQDLVIKQFTDALKDEDKSLHNMLSGMKKEGIELGVEATPTFFISDRKYRDDLDLASIEDFVEEEYDRKSGKW